MSDFDFLKDFGENLDREQPHEPSDADWDKLATALEVEDRGKRRRRLLMAWAFPLAASMALAVLGTMLWQTRSQADLMRSEIARLKLDRSGSKTDVSIDTTVQRVTVIQYDTIYRTVVIRSIVPGESSQEYARKTVSPNDANVQTPNNQSIKIDSPDKTAGNVSIQNTPKEMGYSKGASNDVDLNQNGDVVYSLPQNPGTTVLKNELAALPLKDILPVRIHHRSPQPNAYDLSVAVHTPVLHVPIIRRLRPHDASIGISSGVHFPQGTDIDLLGSYMFGLNGQLSIGRHIRLTAEAERGNTDFRIRGYVLDKFNLPPITPPTPDDVLSYIEVKQPLWDYSLGLRYVFTPDKRLRPFVGAAWVGEQTQEQTLKYEFRNNMTEEETYTLLPYNDSRFSANGLRLGIGATWAFTQHLSFGLEGVYQRQYGNLEPSLAERWGFKGAVAYNF